MLMTTMLIATISLIVLSLLVVSLMVWFPPHPAIPSPLRLVDGFMEQEHIDQDKQNHVAFVLKAVISAEALVYIGVNAKLLYRWVSGQ